MKKSLKVASIIIVIISILILSLMYLKNWFIKSIGLDDLTKNKESKSLQIIGKISIDTKEATLYYMSALDDNGEVMYYFYAIV